MDVPLKAAFGGLRGLPWLALSNSSIAPRLTLGEDGIEYRVIAGVTVRPYAEIETVDFRKGWGTRNIVLTFHGAMRTFTGNVRDEESARAALALLRDKGCTLSSKAAAALGSAA